MIPIQLRVGGAFLALAVVLVIYAAVAFFRGQAVFEITPQVLTIAAAALLFGANATFVRGQSRSRAQVVALVVAVGLVILGVLLPAATMPAPAARSLSAGHERHYVQMNDDVTRPATRENQQPR